MEEQIAKTTIEMLMEAFPPESVVVISLLIITNIVVARVLWTALQKKENELILVSSKAVEVFEKVEQVYENNGITDDKLNKIITTLEILKDRVHGGS